MGLLGCARNADWSSMGPREAFSSACGCPGITGAVIGAGPGLRCDNRLDEAPVDGIRPKPRFKDHSRCSPTAAPQVESMPPFDRNEAARHCRYGGSFPAPAPRQTSAASPL
jgi:hypothetical protein